MCVNLYCCLSYPACITLLFTQHYIVICGMFFTHYLINGTIFGKERNVEHKMPVLIFCTTLAETFLILRKIHGDVINAHMSSCKVSVVLVIF